MARKYVSQDFAKQSDPDFNPQFRRRWDESPRKERKGERKSRYRAWHAKAR